MGDAAKEILGKWAFEHGLSAKVVRAVPGAKLDYRPHEKSKSMGELAWHLAEAERFFVEKGLGIAVKLADGAARAKMGVFAALLGRLGLTDAADALAEAVEGEIRDSNGRTVGSIRVTLPA